MPHQLEQVVRGGDEVPFPIDLFQASQQEGEQASGFPDLTLTPSTIAFRWA